MKDPLRLDDLKLHVFRPPLSRSEARAFEDVYLFWDQIWQVANEEIGRTAAVPSDMLTRQHEILALYYKGVPIATVCHRFVDFSTQSTFNDSFFVPEIWYQEDKKAIQKMGGYGIIGNQITVRRDFRKSTADSDVKYLITFLSLYRSQLHDVDMIVAMMRSDKGLDRIVYEAGAEPLVKQRAYRNIVVDLVTFHPQTKPIRIPAKYEEWVLELTHSATKSELIDLELQKLRRAA